MPTTNDTNTLTNLVNSQTTNILSNCDTNTCSQVTSLDDLSQKTQQIENLISLLQNNISDKEEEIGYMINDKLEIVHFIGGG